MKNGKDQLTLLTHTLFGTLNKHSHVTGKFVIIGQCVLLHFAYSFVTVNSEAGTYFDFMSLFN